MSYGSGYVIGYIIGLLVHCIVFGIITRAINTSKGRDGGFAWGFFLGAIGIVVVACRRSIAPTTSYSYQPSQQGYSGSSYNNGYNNYASNASLQAKAPAAPKKPAGWKCAKCGKENESASKFCSECGEKRHYKWICAQCGKENAPDIKFCPECGNRQTEEQELIPQPISADEAFLESLREMSSAGEIADAFAAKYGSCDNEDIAVMLKILEQAKSAERTYGNMKSSSLKKVEAFFNNNMTIYAVDRSQSTFECPACGKTLKSDRTNCFSCGALFRE